MNMDFDSGNEPPRQRSLSLSNRKPDQDYHGVELETERVRPHTITEPNTITDFSINPSDVLCGRGKLSFNHVGNRRFRDMVGVALTKYHEAESRTAKASVVNAIVEEIRASGGRFLRRDEEAGTWHNLNHAQCREKVGHAIRDATSSIEARKKRQRLQEAARTNVASAIFAKPAKIDHSGVKDTGLAVLKSGYEKSSAYIISEEAPSLSSQLRQNRLKEPSDFKQGLASNVSSSPARKSPTSDEQLSNDDQQFLALIDEVLAPLGPLQHAS